MLKKNYYIDTKNFKCNKNTNTINPNLCISIYHSLNEFIQYNKIYFNSKRGFKIDKINGVNEIDLKYEFNDIFHDFIDFVLHEIKINKYEKITIHQYDDFVVIYTNNKKYEYTFF